MAHVFSCICILLPFTSWSFEQAFSGEELNYNFMFKSIFEFTIANFAGSEYLPNGFSPLLLLHPLSPPPIHPPLTVFVKKWSKIWKSTDLKIVIWATAVIQDLSSSIISREGHFTILQICNKTNLEQNPGDWHEYGSKMEKIDAFFDTLSTVFHR